MDGEGLAAELPPQNGESARRARSEGGNFSTTALVFNNCGRAFQRASRTHARTLGTSPDRWRLGLRGEVGRFPGDRLDRRRATGAQPARLENDAPRRVPGGAPGGGGPLRGGPLADGPTAESPLRTRLLHVREPRAGEALEPKGRECLDSHGQVVICLRRTLERGNRIQRARVPKRLRRSLADGRCRVMPNELAEHGNGSR
jgi:hypothetical protein